MISYAQNFEDVMLWRALRHIEGGFYLDIGAQDPVIDSVSLVFYQQGWRGVHVEPTPAYAQALRDARPDETVVQAVIGEEPGLIPFYEISDSGISTGDPAIALRHQAKGYENRRIDVPCIRLSALFDSVGGRDVHWMKIDVEGMEASVLRSWTPAHARPWVVVIESTLPLSTELSHAAWEETVLALGYRFAYFDGLNRFYVSGEHGELMRAFAAPPNVHDGFVMAGSSTASFCAMVNGTVAQANAELDRLRRDKADLERQLETARSSEEVARQRIGDLEQRIATRSGGEAQRHVDELLEQFRQLGHAAQRSEQARDDALQALRAAGSSQQAQAVQTVAAYEEALRLQQTLREREQALADARSQLSTAQSTMAQLHADLARQRDDQRAHAATRDAAFATELQDARNAAALDMQREMQKRLADQDLRHAQLLSGVQQEGAQLRSQLADQHQAGRAALEAVRQDIHEVETRRAAALTSARLAELDLRHGEELARLRADGARELQGAAEHLARADDEVARLRASLVQETRSAAVALQAARERGEQAREAQLHALRDDMQARLAEQERAFRQHVGHARDDAARLQARLLEQQQAFAAELDSARTQARDAAAQRMQDELQQHVAHEAAAAAGRLAASRTEADLLLHARLDQQQRRFDDERAAARAEADIALVQLRRQLADAAQQAQQQLADLQQTLAVEFAALRRGRLVKLRDALLRPAAPRLAAASIAAAAQPAATSPAAPLPVEEPPRSAAMVSTTPSPPFETASFAFEAAEAADAAESAEWAAADVPSYDDADELLNEPDVEGRVLNDLLILNGVSFVRAAYRTLLQREADADGERNYVALLRSGLDKTALLGAMARSEEGRRQNVRLPGLRAALWRRRLARAPLLGPLLLRVAAPFRRMADHDPARAYSSQLIDMQRSALDVAQRTHLALVEANRRRDAARDSTDLRSQQTLERLDQLVRQLSERQDQFQRSLAELSARAETSFVGLHEQQQRLQERVGELLALKPVPAEFAERIEAAVGAVRSTQGELADSLRGIGSRQDDIGASMTRLFGPARNGNGADGGSVHGRLLQKAAAWKG